jgi:hypothetical protein
LEQIPLNAQLTSHFPNELGIPVHGAAFSGIVIALIQAPRIVLGYNGRVSNRIEIRAIYLVFTPMPLLRVSIRGLGVGTEFSYRMPLLAFAACCSLPKPVPFIFHKSF